MPGINHLLSAGAPGSGLAAGSKHIAGFASLNYRLSPHPAFPQDRETTAPSHLRVARHPDHLRDVQAALLLLHEKFGVGAAGMPYVLYGHSAGATLALQVVMGEGAIPAGDGAAASGGAAVVSAPAGIPMPVAVVGFEGVYDLRGLNDRKGGAYGTLWAGAFGPDERGWDVASPARFRGGFKERWGKAGKLVVLAYSPEDELVDMGEIDAMEKTLREDGVHILTYRDLKGGHDEVVVDGRYVARVMDQTIEELHRLEKTG